MFTEGNVLYQLHELHHIAVQPWRLFAEATRAAFTSPANPWALTEAGRAIAASAELFERATRRFARPRWMIRHTGIDGHTVPVRIEPVLAQPFCTLLHFRRLVQRDDPRLLLVAPLSGHYATLLRDTVRALLPHHEIWVTDWIDARAVPLARGSFGFDDYVAYVIEHLRLIGPGAHVVAVCQPAVPVMAAVSLMAADGDPACPRTMTLMGGPIDPMAEPTAVTELARTRSLDWFERHVIGLVPPGFPGAMRRVYPGFIQLSGFMSMNLDRHVGAHVELFEHLVRGDGDSAAAHRRFYDEYLAVMDLPAEFYLETVERVFQRGALAAGTLEVAGRPVDPGAIRSTALMTIEGELDDISAPGQTRAAHALCRNLPHAMHREHLQPGCGHYGIFNGRRWRNEIMPELRDFIRSHDSGRTPV